MLAPGASTFAASSDAVAVGFFSQARRIVFAQPLHRERGVQGRRRSPDRCARAIQQRHREGRTHGTRFVTRIAQLAGYDPDRTGHRVLDLPRAHGVQLQRAERNDAELRCSCRRRRHEGRPGRKRDERRQRKPRAAAHCGRELEARNDRQRFGDARRSSAFPDRLDRRPAGATSAPRVRSAAASASQARPAAKAEASGGSSTGLESRSQLSGSPSSAKELSFGSGFGGAGASPFGRSSDAPLSPSCISSSKRQSLSSSKSPESGSEATEVRGLRSDCAVRPFGSSSRSQDGAGTGTRACVAAASAS